MTAGFTAALLLIMISTTDALAQTTGTQERARTVRIQIDGFMKSRSGAV